VVKQGQRFNIDSNTLMLQNDPFRKAPGV